MTSDAPENLNQKVAEQIGRLFVMLFNSSILYGSTHPATKKNAGTFFESLSKSLSNHGMLSFIVNQDSLLIEDHPLDKTTNINKLVQHFDKIGLRSVSFEKGVTRSDIESFVALAGDTTNIPSTQEEITGFTPGDIPNIRINYVVFGKITADQAQPKGLCSDPQPHSETTHISNRPQTVFSAQGLSTEALKQIEQVLTLSSLLEEPSQVAEVLSKAKDSPNLAYTVSETLGKLKTEISDAQPHTVKELLEAIFKLKTDLTEAIEIQKVTGRMMKSSDLLSDQMNELTCDAIVKLVKEEYGSGKLSLKRLTQIIRRMLPDSSELMSVLPQLKKMLLSEGMTLNDYLELIRMLDMEMRSEALSVSLNDAADSIGASVSDLVEAIKSKPDEAAQLVLLASEIRHGTEKDSSGLAEILTNHIEEVCSQMALQNNEITGPQGGQALKKVLAKLESQLFAQLRKKGVEEPVLLKVKKQLTERFEATFNSVSDKWIEELVDSNGEKDIEALSQSIRNFAGNSFQQSRLQDSLSAALKSRGYDNEQIRDFFTQLTKQVASGGKVVLPQNALGSNNMRFLTNRELKQHIRYNTPFSSITITLNTVTQQKECRSADDEDQAQLLPQVFSCTKALLRDIDLIGAIDIFKNPAIFAILSMTDEKGALIVKDRIKKKIEDSSFILNNKEAKIKARVSVTVPDDKIKDLRSYLEKTRKDHGSEKQHTHL
ncbi:MAG: hypothetical protein ACLFQB_00460 [Chitinispirillaceae bacterium]